jgi:hypothetical protein
MPTEPFMISTPLKSPIHKMTDALEKNESWPNVAPASANGRTRNTLAPAIQNLPTQVRCDENHP